jgi:mRNA-degrading endonuclease toxin of MazEF toxin-antitoxin module
MTAPVDVRQGEIYWVDIPASQTVGSEQYNRRPYIIVSRTLVNRRARTVVGVPLSTTGADDKGTHPPHRIIIPAAEITRDTSYTGDIRESVAKTDQVRVLAKERLGIKVGSLSTTASVAVGLGLAFLFDLR